MARLLLNAGADVTVRDARGYTPLHSVGSIPPNTTLLLLERGAEISARCLRSYTPLYNAAGFGCLKSIDALLKRGASPSEQNQYRRVPLHNAIASPEITGALLESGASPNMPDIHGLTPLHLVTMGFVLPDPGEEEPDQLFNHTPCYKGRLMLPVAAVGPVFSRSCREIPESTQLEVLIRLLNCGADVTHKCLSGCTPLHFASQINRVGIVRALLMKGADPLVACAHKRTPLSIAMQFECWDVIHALVESNAYEVESLSSNYDLLHYAIEHHLDGLVLSLLRAGIDISKENDNGLTPLHHAIVTGQTTVVHNLLQMDGVDITITSRSGLTPLHLAARVPDGAGIIRNLLERGAKMSEKDSVGMTVLDHAKLWGTRAASKCLKQYGAKRSDIFLGDDGYSIMKPIKEAWRRNCGFFYEDNHDLFNFLVHMGVSISDLGNEGKRNEVVRKLNLEDEE